MICSLYLILRAWKMAHLTLKGVHLDPTMTMACQMKMESKSNWAEKTAHLNLMDWRKRKALMRVHNSHHYKMALGLPKLDHH